MLGRPEARFAIALGLLVLGFLIIPLAPLQPAVSYGVAFIFTSLLYLILARVIWTSKLNPSLLYLALAIGIAVRARAL